MTFLRFTWNIAWSELCKLCCLNREAICLCLRVNKRRIILESPQLVDFRIKICSLSTFHYLDFCYWAKSSLFIFNWNTNSIFQRSNIRARHSLFWTKSITFWSQSLCEGFTSSFSANFLSTEIWHNHRILLLNFTDARIISSSTLSFQAFFL